MVHFVNAVLCFISEVVTCPWTKKLGSIDKETWKSREEAEMRGASQGWIRHIHGPVSEKDCGACHPSMALWNPQVHGRCTGMVEVAGVKMLTYWLCFKWMWDSLATTALIAIRKSYDSCRLNRPGITLFSTWPLKFPIWDETQTAWNSSVLLGISSLLN